MRKLEKVGRQFSPRTLQEQLMRAALDTARDGMKNGEAPIGAVLARGDGSIIARGYNAMQGSQNKTAHAEIVTFANAAGKVPLDARDLLLVSTLEPCVMCTGAAMEAAVDTILFALDAPADNGSTRVVPPQSPESQMPRLVGGVLPEESRALFEEYLRDNPDSPSAPLRCRKRHAAPQSENGCNPTRRTWERSSFSPFYCCNCVSPTSFCSFSRAWLRPVTCSTSAVLCKIPCTTRATSGSSSTRKMRGLPVAPFLPRRAAVLRGPRRNHHNRQPADAEAGI